MMSLAPLNMLLQLVVVLNMSYLTYYLLKVEGAKTNTYKRLSIANAIMLQYLEAFPIVQECLGPWSDVLGVTQEHPPLLSCRVGNKLHSISGLLKMGLECLVDAYSSHSTVAPGGGVCMCVTILAIIFIKPRRQPTKHNWDWFQVERGLVPRMQ